MVISSIVNGIVIDHIPAGKGMELYNYLKLDEYEGQVAFIQNAPSGKYGKKDILKISEIMDIDLDVVGYIAPHSTVNIIENGERIKKFHPELPEKLTDIIKCKNPRCITSVEQELIHKFKLTDRIGKVYRCVYCESKF